MIITQTPLRISLFGGGTDFRDFYRKEGGAVLSLGIDKYVYVIIKERFDDGLYLNYSKKEEVKNVDEIHHDLIREALRKTHIKKGIEITTLADVPSEGSGLGSSSSITAGLLNTFYAYQGEQVDRERLAREACEIEIDILKNPIGDQDQYIASYGGLHFFEFQKDGKVKTERMPLSDEHTRKLVGNLLLFYVNKTRSASEILVEQKRNIGQRMDELKKLRDMAYHAKELVLKQEFDEVGRLLGVSWQEKKKLARGVTTPEIDSMYQKAMRGGALGGKISGAGGGGFLLLYCPVEKQDVLKAAMKEYRELPFSLSKYGSNIIFNIVEHVAK